MHSPEDVLGDAHGKQESHASAGKQEEYEEAAKKLLDLINATAESKTHVHSVRIEGAQRTRESFLLSAINPVFKARTIGSVISSVQEAASNLKRLDIFEDVNVLLDTPSDPFADEEAVDVVLLMKEKSRVWIKTGTEIGNGEGNMNGSVNLRNILGGAESLETNVAFGTRTSSAFHFCLAKPVNGSPDAKIDVNAFNVVRNNMMYSAHEELMKGAGVRFRGVSKFGYHELSYNATWRTIDRIAEHASLSVREQAGHSLKSSANHTFVHDRRDDPVLPTRGHMLKIMQELAGVGGLGDTQFIKNEVEAQANVGLGKGVVLSTTLRGGLLYTLDGKPSRINDRFFLGGPSSIRGFRAYGVGPREKNDALGGDAYWAAGLSLITPLPFGKLKDLPLKGHLFVNGGSLIPYKHGIPPRDTVEALVKSPSVAVGGGLIYRHSIVRLELNMCLPLLVTASDSYKRGLQFGLGLSFL